MPATKNSQGSQVPATSGSDANRLGHVFSSKYSVTTHRTPRIGIAAANTTAWDWIRTTKPPNGVFTALAFVGRALRFRLDT